ncbi:MAG: DMT family transporter [Cyanobacteria bacterium J06641_5]
MSQELPIAPPAATIAARSTTVSSLKTPVATAFGALFLAIVALSLAAIFIRLCEQELGPFATIFNRFWIAFLCLLTWNQVNALLARRRNASTDAAAPTPTMVYSRADILLLILAGVMFWFCLALWAWSLTQTGVANSTILHNLTPIFITVGAWLFLGQKFDTRFAVGLVLALVGGTALGLGDLQAGADSFVGDVASLLSAAFSAANLILIERLRSKYSAAIIIQWCCGVGVLLTFPVMLVTETQIFPISWLGWFYAICLALVCQIVGQGLQAYCVKVLRSSLVGIFLLLDPVLAALIAWGIFAESLSVFNWVSFFVVIFGIYLAKTSKYADRVLAE